MDISPQVQHQLQQFQALQEQLQAVTSQRYQMDVQLTEANKTLEELGKVKDADKVYKSIGNLLVETKDRDKLKGDLEEQKETLEVRIKTLEKQEKQLKESFTQMQEQLQKALQGQGLA